MSTYIPNVCHQKENLRSSYELLQNFLHFSADVIRIRHFLLKSTFLTLTSNTFLINIRRTLPKIKHKEIAWALKFIVIQRLAVLN